MWRAVTLLRRQSAEDADPQLAAATQILRSSVLTQQCDDSSTCRLVNMSVTPTRRYSNGQGSRPGFHRQVTTDHISSHLWIFMISTSSEAPFSSLDSPQKHIFKWSHSLGDWFAQALTNNGKLISEMTYPFFPLHSALDCKNCGEGVAAHCSR